MIFIFNTVWLWFLLCNFAVRKKIVMITLTFHWLVGLVALVFVATLILVACYKSPMRKWLCFAISTITIAYLLYIMLWQQHESGQRLEWYLLGCVGIIAALVLSGVGFMDLVKPITNTAPIDSRVDPSILVSNENKQADTDAVSIDTDSTADINVDDVNTDVGSKGKIVSADVTEAEDKDDAENELEEDASVDTKNDANNDALNEAERIQREELIGKVMPWFLDQLNQYGEKERNAIKVCAIDFVKEGKFSSPTVAVQNNKLYSHSRIIEICSALYLIGDDNNACVDFIKEVFAEPFANTEESTILKKLSGSDKMLEIIDTYWEAQGIKVEKSRLSPKK